MLRNHVKYNISYLSKYWKKVLYVEMSYSDYNYFVTLLTNNPDLMAKFIKSFHSYQIKYKIEDNPSISNIAEDIDELLSKLSI